MNTVTLDRDSLSEMLELEPPALMLDEVTFDGLDVTARLAVTDGICAGHFDRMPGVKQVTMVEQASRVTRLYRNKDDAQLVTVKSVSFDAEVNAGDELTASVDYADGRARSEVWSNGNAKKAAATVDLTLGSLGIHGTERVKIEIPTREQLAVTESGLQATQEDLPHRDPMQFLAGTIEEGGRTFGIVNVSGASFEGVPDGSNIWSSSLSVEAIAQLGARQVIMAAREAEGYKGDPLPVFAGIEDAKFYKQVIRGQLAGVTIDFIDTGDKRGKRFAGKGVMFDAEGGIIATTIIKGKIITYDILKRRGLV